MNNNDERDYAEEDANRQALRDENEAELAEENTARGKTVHQYLTETRRKASQDAREIVDELAAENPTFGEVHQGWLYTRIQTAIQDAAADAYMYGITVGTDGRR